MSELKTKLNDGDVMAFIESVDDEQKRLDSLKLLNIFETVTGETAKMWGTSMIGFGVYHYKSERSSQEGDWPLAAFSPRKQNLSLYVLSTLPNAEPLLEKLGKHKIGKGCLYINRLSDVDTEVLTEIIRRSYEEAKRTLAN